MANILVKLVQSPEPGERRVAEEIGSVSNNRCCNLLMQPKPAMNERKTTQMP